MSNSILPSPQFTVADEATKRGFGAEEIAAGRLGWANRALKPISILTVILLWQAAGSLNERLHLYNPRLFPTPVDVVASALKLAQTGVLWVDVYVSSLR